MSWLLVTFGKLSVVFEVKFQIFVAKVGQAVGTFAVGSPSNSNVLGAIS